MNGPPSMNSKLTSTFSQIGLINILVKWKKNLVNDLAYSHIYGNWSIFNKLIISIFGWHLRIFSITHFYRNSLAMKISNNRLKFANAPTPSPTNAKKRSLNVLLKFILQITCDSHSFRLLSRFFAPEVEMDVYTPFGIHLASERQFHMDFYYRCDT